MATIKGTINNDLLLAGSEDIVLGLEGNDEIDAGLGSGGNTLGGGADNDLLYAGTGDLLLGDTGNDELDASDEGGNNSLYGGKGQDTLYTGKNDKAFGGAGDDTLYAGTGDNTLYGGTGRDRFWLANAEIPTSVNTVADFNAQADQIVIKLDGVNALTNLSFQQTGTDTVIKLAATGESLAIVQNTASTVFNSNNVIFNETTPLNATPALNNPKKQDRKTVTGVENLGLVTFTTDTSFKDTQVGGLSGIVYDQAQNRYYAISDDRSSINPARFYTLEINLSDGRLDSGDVSFTQVTTLLDSQGNPFPTNSLDTEGIALTENGSVYISSEGEARPDIPRLTNPFVNQFSLSGQQLSQLPIDEKFFAVDGTTKGIRNNLAFESLTITPDGRYLYTATENALASDGTAATLTDNSLSRIVKYDLTTGQVVAEFVYEVEPIPKASNPIGGFADNGLVELLAIDNNGTLLSLERSFAVGVGNTVKLYQIQTQGALDVSSFDDLFSETQNTRFAIDSPVKKKLLVDFQADLGITPDNLEGLSLGPVLLDGRQSLIVVSDNNFNATQTTQFIALGLDIQTTPAVLPVIETADAIDDANGETTTLGLLGDSDDPAVWIDPDNTEDSLIIGTLKDGGLAVFSLDGEVLQKITPTDILGATADFGDLRYNNVDVLYNFQLGTETVDIALVSDRANDTLNIFKIDPTTHTLVNLTSSQLLAPAFSVFGVDDGEATVYGLAGYRSPVSGKSYVFVTQASGNKIAQLELKADAQGLITAEVVRTINLPIAVGKTASDYQSEAIAVDQEKGIVYLAVENEIGLVKFAAEPNGGNTVTVVRPVGSPELVPDLEGLAIYYGPNGTGYLVASSQGDSSYAVYSREGSNGYLGSFVVGDNLPAGIDQANETDGLEIINVPLGPTFPFGALLVQDGANDPQNAVENGDELENNNTNFKFVRWDDVANAFETPLNVDTTSYNPRNSDLNPQSLVNGIASGDVDQNSAILWARSLFVGEVSFEYSKDANFSAIAGKKTVNVTDSTIPVKVEVIGLTANTEYFYRVTDTAGDTATGRFQTAALAGEKKGLTFGVSGDWRGELAPYPAISNVAAQELDFFVELGDTIYADYGSDAVLNADGSRKAQVETLAEYRAKHAEVYGSRLGENYWAQLRASTSVFATIDDHEVINDFAGGANASTDERFSTTTGLINDTELYENGLTAFQEYNPLTDKFYADNTGDVRFDGERKLYRNNAFGKDASVFVLDTRSFRDEGINFTDANNDTIPDNPAAVLVDSLTTERTLLGAVQLAEFKQDLLAAQASGQTWKFVMLPEPIQNILPGINVDAYEGYGKERAELLKFINDNKITNVVFVAADIHTTSVNNLTYQLAPGGEQIATSAFEITTGGVAFDQPLGEILGNFVSASNPTFAAGYAAAPIAPDTDSNPNDKDDLVKLAIKQQILQPGGFDPIGLNDNLAQAEGLIDATLLKGDYFVGHSYGWTEFDVDPLTQKLTVTTYGIDAYSEAEILAQAGNLDSLNPTIVSQFEVNPQSEPNPTPQPPITLTAIGTYATGQYNQSAAEIPAYDPASKRLFVVNAQKGKVDVLDASNPTNPTLIISIDISAFGLPNSVAIKDGLVAIAVENIDKQAKGQVLFYSANSQDFATPLKALEVGALPDMLTFSPDGKKVLVANEGEPNGTYTNDPEGSVSIIDLSLGVNSATVKTADFTAFNSQFAQLKAAGVKFKGDVGTTRTVAQDLEPEYIAVSPDGTKAWVTLQEANAIAVIDIATATVESIKPLGFKDYSVPSTRLETFEFSNLPSIGKTAANQELFLGGFSGLFYEGTAANGNLKFVTHTDRGPNGEPTGSNRPFLLPNFSPEIVRFELDRSTGAITITERINLKQADGTAITGLPNTNIAGGNGNTPYNDEVPVDLQGNPITPLDKLGGDFEAIVLANDGSFWMVDEYRPAIYHFGTDGKLIERFVPQGTAVAAGQPAGTFGTEVLPSILAQRRQNRGFEAIALNKDNNKLYAFVQSPLRNPTTLSNSNLNNLNNVRIIEFDVVTKTVTAEYLYRLDNGNLGTTDNTRPDKIGDAVYIGDGEFLLVERDDDAIDSDPLSNIEKKVYRFSLDGATNVLNQDATIDLGGGNLKTIDQMTPAELVSQGINLVAKNLHVDLAKAGYNTVEKVEGLTLVDANTIAVLNDNDFQVAGITLNGDGTFIPDPNPDPIVLGLITTQPQELDASDRDTAINIRNWSIFGMYQPDAIASYTANNQTYYITANEGDAREYGDYVEGVRIKDLNLDPTAFPDAADLKTDPKLGRLLVTTERGDTDGDGDYDQLYTFGGRSFSIWNNQGQLVYDSGDDFERITAEQFPEYFNASNSNNTFDNRSDDKGPEPEGVVTGIINGRTYAFIGLERIGGVMVYDVTDPMSPTFVQYINNRDFTVATDSAAAKDLGPEGLAFISAQDSPNGKPLLVVANEVSGSTTFYQIDLNEAPINNPPTAVILSNTVTALAENSNTAGGIKVADISITDDGQGTNVLSLSGTDATSFEIRGNALFFVGNSPDFETKAKYDVTVNVDDKSVGETPDASTDFTLNITNLPDQNISDRVSQFNNKGNNLGSLVYNLSDVSGNANTQADNTALNQTDALFHNLVGLYQVENADGGIFDTLDLNGNGLTNDLLNPGDAGYARTAITNAVNNFVLQMGANDDPADNTSASEFGDVLLQGGKRYSPFAIANGGNLIPTGGTLQDGINNFLAQNPNNTAADLSNFMNHAVAYFSFGMANPDGTEHLQNRGNNVFGFEDLPGNLGISDFDFNDAVFKFTFIG